MDDRDEVSDAGAARGEVPWEYDFTLARVRRPRLVRPTVAAAPKAAQEDARPSPTPSSGLESIEDTVRLTEGVPAALGPRVAPTGAREPHTPPGDAGALPQLSPDEHPHPHQQEHPLPHPHPHPGPHQQEHPHPHPHPHRGSRRRRWSAARTELVIKVACGIALVTGTAALVVLAFTV
ncbi:hypothetical protein GCM10010988_17840 [Cnuibacter physcomitrellae]|uniref:Uncharacterized protein n=1 Tax=Cnuibacter physcomitrellae TaxID=1619308 RepID=A0A1X9LTK8_9MICO|nr:hypothetical protein [Cnuibacter physcomitrellae]ARJ06519.1 hypothetical protein B5808_15810 [Cnuibacter physcomitrellae]GGI38207.1 hypothetical protein GCM10010988_17840 [Cnuibacter physcomitrellae]